MRSVSSLVPTAVVCLLLAASQAAHAELTFTFAPNPGGGTLLTIEGSGTYTGPSVSSGGFAFPTYAAALGTVYPDPFPTVAAPPLTFDVVINGIALLPPPFGGVNMTRQPGVGDRLDVPTGTAPPGSPPTGTNVPFTYFATFELPTVDFFTLSVGTTPADQPFGLAFGSADFFVPTIAILEVPTLSPALLLLLALGLGGAGVLAVRRLAG